MCGEAFGSCDAGLSGRAIRGYRVVRYEAIGLFDAGLSGRAIRGYRVIRYSKQKRASNCELNTNCNRIVLLL